MDRSSRPRAEAGFTVIELAVTMLIAAIVTASLLGILESQARVERRVTSLANNQEQVRQTLVLLQRDLRSAEPLIPLSDAFAYPRQVELLHLDFDSDAVLRFRWRLDTTRKELVRETLASNGSVSATTHRLAGVANTAVFRYFSSNGGELEPGVATSATIATCTIRMRIDLRSAPDRGSPPLPATSDVDLRNRLPGNAACGQ